MSDAQSNHHLSTTSKEVAFIREAVVSTTTELRDLINSIYGKTPSGWIPEDLNAAYMTMEVLQGKFVNIQAGRRGDFEVFEGELPMFRLSLEEHMQKIIEKKEATAALTHSEEPQRQLDEQLAIGQGLLDRAIFLSVEPATRLALSKFFNLETAQKFQTNSIQLEPRQFDEKFHILVSQTLFMKDLQYFRKECAFRDRPVSVAYIDIDEFKKFNQALTETRVDKEILPRFMTALEAFVFGRGYAYREGGDEYLVLVPGAGPDEAGHFFQSLRKHLECLKYSHGNGPTVSIGVCTADASERLTALQIQQFANNAKAFAKKNGRNCVAIYDPGKKREYGTLQILP